MQRADIEQLCVDEPAHHPKLWYRDTSKKGANGSAGGWAIKKVIEIPAEPADPEALPPILKGFKAAAPLVTDIDLSVDDRFLYVSCWGTGEFIQYDVTDPFHPKKVTSFRLGGMVGRAAHPSKPDQPLNGGPQMVEVSRDGRRVYFTNSLYTPWDNQFYPDGVQGWIAKVDVRPDGGMELDRKFFVETGSLRAHQVRLEGGTLRPIRTATPKRYEEDDMDWEAMAFLGVYHGINPGMGWLFAVALGLQQGSARGVWRALPPIVAGHAAAVGVVLLIAGLAQLIVPFDVLRFVVASMLIVLGSIGCGGTVIHDSAGCRSGFAI